MPADRAEPTASTAVVEAGAPVAHNLPSEPSSFVGRQRELRQVAAALSGSRVVTLTGPGGCGKSRLALQAVADALGGFPDGGWWVELSPLSDPALVAPALAQVLGVRPLPGQGHLEAVVAYLAPRRALVVLDNCEHLLDEAARVVQALVAGCPQVTVLATSREPLKVEAEAGWEVPPLSLLSDDAADPETVGRSDAVRLFLLRAGEARPGVQAATAQVVRICRRVDGIPLAIELAAARVRVLTVEQIAEGLSDFLWLLGGGTHTELPRHETLRASVDWSHDLLTESERALFRRLGVFAGGFILEAAERVGAGEGVERKDVLDLLAGLIDKSLVQAEEHGPVMRYRLLEPIRQYAFERLEQASETDATRDRHRDAYLELAERLAPELLTPRQLEVLDLLDRDAANFSEAIGWAASSDAEKALRLCIALTFWWRLRGLFSQGEKAFRQALEVPSSEPSSLRARALWGRSFLLVYAGAFETAIPMVNEALAQAEQVGDKSTMARALYGIGTMISYPDPIGSRTTLQRARELAAESDDDFCILGVTAVLAYTYLHQSDPAGARRLLDEVLPLLERMGHQEMFSWYWNAVAASAYLTGEVAACREACHRAIVAARRIEDVVTEALASTTLALTQIDAGDPRMALERLSALRERAIAHGGAFTVPWVEMVMALADAAAGELKAGREAFEELIGQGAGGGASALIWAHAHLAETLRLLRETAAADAVARRVLEMVARTEDRLHHARGQLLLGLLAAGRGKWREGQRLLHEALEVIIEDGYRLELPRAFQGLAEVAAGLESYTEAGRILGAAARVRRESVLVPWKHQREEVDALEGRVREALGGEAFEAAFREGEGLRVDEAVAYVRRARGARKRPSIGWESLTPTEVEIVRHAAVGLTNPEIAKRMFITRGTVKVHLSNIYAKLGVRNRAELVAESGRRADASQD